MAQSAYLPHRHSVDPNSGASSYLRLRLLFWSLGIILAIFQTWNSRHYATTDGISYMDMSDGVLRGQDWHRLITGVWSPLYPVIMGVFRGVVLTITEGC